MDFAFTTASGGGGSLTLPFSGSVDTGDKIIVAGGSDDSNNVVSLVLFGINAKGVGVYDLRRSSVLDNLPACVITLNASNSAQGRAFNTLYGPAASNGTLTVTQYDKANQKLSGTFSFTAGAIPNTPATGIQAVSSGSFSFTHFR